MVTFHEAFEPISHHTQLESVICAVYINTFSTQQILHGAFVTHHLSLYITQTLEHMGIHYIFSMPFGLHIHNIGCVTHVSHIHSIYFIEYMLHITTDVYTENKKLVASSRT